MVSCQIIIMKNLRSCLCELMPAEAFGEIRGASVYEAEPGHGGGARDGARALWRELVQPIAHAF